MTAYLFLDSYFWKGEGGKSSEMIHIVPLRYCRCIFVWRLPSDMTKTMRSRMEELGKMPQEETFASDVRWDGLITSDIAILAEEMVIKRLEGSTVFAFLHGGGGGGGGGGGETRESGRLSKPYQEE